MLVKIADNRGTRDMIRAYASYVQHEYLRDDADSPLNYLGSNSDSNPFFDPQLIEDFKFDWDHPLVKAIANPRKKKTDEAAGVVPTLSKIKSQSRLKSRSSSSSQTHGGEDLDGIKYVIRDDKLENWIKNVGPVYYEIEKLAYLSVVNENAEGQVPTYNIMVQEAIGKREKQTSSLSSRLSSLLGGGSIDTTANANKIQRRTSGLTSTSTAQSRTSGLSSQSFVAGTRTSGLNASALSSPSPIAATE